MTATRPPKPPAAAGSGGTISPVTLERLEALRELWAAGTPTRELARHAREVWGLKDRASRELVAKLRRQLRAEVSSTERADYTAELVERYREQYRAAHAVKNHAAAVGALSGMARVLGIPDADTIRQQALQQVIARLLQALEAAPISGKARQGVRLSLAAHGLLPPPDLSALTLQELDAFARHGAHGLLPSLLEAPAGSIAALADGDAVTGQAEP